MMKKINSKLFDAKKNGHRFLFIKFALNYREIKEKKTIFELN